MTKTETRPDKPTECDPYILKQAVAFDEKTFPAQGGSIRGESWNAYIDSLWLAKDLEPMSLEDLRCKGTSIDGHNRFGLCVFPMMVWDSIYAGGELHRLFLPSASFRWQHHHLAMASGAKKVGSVCFTTDVYFPWLGSAASTWMSLTPSELVSQRQGIRRAKGHVLVGGCGLGWFAARCADRTQVKSVTVVDSNPHILEFFGEKLQAQYGGKIKLLDRCAYEEAEKNADSYDSILFDIWPHCNDARYDARWHSIVYDCQENGKGVWGWGWSRATAPAGEGW